MYIWSINLFLPLIFLYFSHFLFQTSACAQLIRRFYEAQLQISVAAVMKAIVRLACVVLFFIGVNITTFPAVQLRFAGWSLLIQTSTRRAPPGGSRWRKARNLETCAHPQFLRENPLFKTLTGSKCAQITQKITFVHHLLLSRKELKIIGLTCLFLQSWGGSVRVWNHTALNNSR